MPTRPSRPCLEPGCSVLLSTGSRCQLHQRPSRHERGYGYEWTQLRAAILERDGWTCYRCGAQANAVDHLLAKARGGDDDPSNLAAICGSCNSSKRDRLT